MRSYNRQRVSGRHRWLSNLLACLALLVGSAPSMASNFCAFDNTNQLVWETAFARSVEAYLGTSREDFLYPNGRVSEQVLSALGGPPDDLVKLAGGLVLASACRHQSCMEKAAVVIKCPNVIKSAAIINYACSKKDCADDAIATLFLGNQPDQRVGEWALKRWARSHGVTTFTERVPDSVRRAMKHATP